MLFDVSRETRRFYNNPFVSRETLFLLYDVPRMSMCFTWNVVGWLSCQGVVFHVEHLSCLFLWLSMVMV